MSNGNGPEAEFAGQLAEYCRSDALSEEGLREKLLDKLINAGLDLDAAELCEELLLHEICDNERVTKGIIRCILDCVPGTSLCADEAGSTPLHYVLWNKNVTLKIVQLLINAAPESIMHQDNDGSMPIHRLCSNPHLDNAVALKILKFLIDYYPKGVRHADKDFNLPIHIACESQPAEFCRMLVEAYPGSERIADSNGMLPLHSACQFGEVATMKYMLGLCPEGMMLLSKYGYGYPLHCAIAGLCDRENGDTAIEIVEVLLSRARDRSLATHTTYRWKGDYKLVTPPSPFESAFLQEYNDSNLPAGLKVIHLLYDACPRAIKVCNPFLLHELCKKEQVAEGLVRCLLEYLPTAASVTDEGKKNPIHHACSNKDIAPNVVQILIDAAPESAHRVGADGKTPLHCLCSNGEMDEAVSLEILSFLINKSPQSIRHADKDGNLPIHVASETRSAEFCRLLVESYPGSEQIADTGGMLPLHVACTYGSVATVKCLIDIFPEGTAVTSDYGNPLHCVIAGICGRENDMDTAVDMVEFLLSRDRNAASQTSDGRLPFESAFLQAYDDSNLHVGLKIIHLLYDAYPQASSACDPFLLRKLCVRKQVAEGLVQCLLDYVPYVASAIDEEGQHFLHLACRIEAITPNTARLLIDAAPDSLRQVDEYGRIPLHYLCGNKFLDGTDSLEILKLFIERCPKLARYSTHSGHLPIHVACGGGMGVGSRAPEFCRVLIESYPGSERITADGLLPLHYACERGSVATVKYLLEVYPDSINVAAENGPYPIQKALRNRAVVVEMVEFLLEYEPNVASQVYMKAPLFWACDNTYRWDLKIGLKLIELLYDAYPEAIVEYEDVFNEAIDDIFSTGEYEVPGFLREQQSYARQATNIQFMTTPSRNGRLPLHIALYKNASLGSIKLLVKGNPSAVQSPDNRGVLPLHVACEDHDSPRVVQYLLGLDKTTLDAEDIDGNSPLHYACRGARFDTIALLVEKYQAASASKRNAQSQLPMDLLLDNCNIPINEEIFRHISSHSRSSIGYTQSVFLLLRAYPEIMMNCI